ncbi:MAG: hypothetical protein ACHQNT_06230 [Bacteroidia bacterium]
MKIVNLLVSTVILTSALSGCDDFIEPDIENKTISIISPPDSFTSSVSTQTFWWEELEGAEEYNLQIVRGTFSYVQQFVLDTTITLTKFQYSLLPGMYEWRVRGENNGGNTSYFTRTLTIDSTLDLSSQTVVLTSPQDNYVTNTTVFTFKWQSLYNAEEYRIQIIDSANNNIISDVTQAETEYDYTLAEGSYTWNVRAQNASSISPYSSRKLTVDLTAPSAPVLVSPLNNAIILFGSNDSLTWSVDAASVADSLFIDTDSTFSNPNKIFTVNTYYIITQSTGAYFWKAKSMDAAGNESAFSAYRKFFIQ